MKNIIERCYYCNSFVYSNDLKFAYTKKFNKNTGKYIYSDYCHMECYIDRMKSLYPVSKETCILDFLK